MERGLLLHLPILKEVSHRFNEEADQFPSLRGILDEAAEEEEG
jgi:hypothetical protein